jgi:colicin import membrane protein
MTAWKDNPGLVVSSTAHVALLVFALVGFARTPPYADAQETIPVEMLTASQFNQITKGDKSAKEVKPTPKVDKVAELNETKPLPPVAEAKKDIPVPPPPLKHQADPGEDEAPKKAESVAVTPPPRPELPKPEVKPAPEKPPPEEAEALDPKPPPRPKFDPPKPDPKPEPKKPEFKPDQVAKLLEQDKQKQPAAKPKSGDEQAEPKHRFDASDISRLLSKETPQRKAATGQVYQQVASLGSPTASAAKMSPSLWAQLDGLLQDQYRQCWSYLGLSVQKKYVPEIHVQYAQDGALIGQPALLNPPNDPALRGLAESAMRAVHKCNPLRIPAQFMPFYDQWKGRVVRFDPDEMT